MGCRAALSPDAAFCAFDLTLVGIGLQLKVFSLLFGASWCGGLFCQVSNVALALKGPVFAHQWFPLSSCLAQLAVFCAFLIPAGQVFSEVFAASFWGAAEASLRHCLQRQRTVPFPVASD